MNTTEHSASRFKFSRMTEQMKGFTRSALVLYVFWILATTLLYVALNLRASQSTGNVESSQHLVLLLFGTPALAASTCLFIYARATAHRKDDPYRFSIKQFRFFEMNTDQLENGLLQFVICGYKLEHDARTDRDILIRGTKTLVIRDQDGKVEAVMPVRMSCHAVRIGETWNVGLSANPSRWYTLVDFNNVLYTALESFTNAAGWTSLKARDFI